MFRLNGEGPWLDISQFKSTFYLRLLSNNNAQTSDEIWSQELKTNTEILMDLNLNIDTDILLDLIFEISRSKEGKSLQELVLKCTEELGELSQAVLSFTGAVGCGYKNLDKNDVIEELADVLLVDLAIVAKLGITKEDFKLIIQKKLNKWNEKISNNDKNKKL